MLVVEDIVDTGHTMKHVWELLASTQAGPVALHRAADKPTRREVGR